MLDPIAMYRAERDAQIERNKHDIKLKDSSEYHTEDLVRTNYTKNFTWMGVPVVQYPGDLMVLQELIWEIAPDDIIECGVAFGGLSMFMASVLEYVNPDGWIRGIDVDVRLHARQVFNSHPASARVVYYEGSSAALETFARATSGCRGKTLVVLDSCHTHDHVLRELDLYAPLVSGDSYIIVFDTAIEFYGHLDKNQDRPWGKGNNPWTAVQSFLKTDMGKNFVIDKDVETRAGITAAPDGWLKRIK